jgi:TetR/AcrR family transcriptional regulator, transcriptional repressor for nem operon
MAYSIKHKASTRRRILEAANRLFAANGYDGTSIDEIMRSCGLTRGGFYAHFSSKGQLYRDALLQDDSVDAVLSEYLGTAQSAGANPAPAFNFLAVDLASKIPEVRAAFSDTFRSICQKLLCHSRASASTNESCSLSTAALIVGALAVAHSTDNTDLRAKLLASCVDNAGALLNRSYHSNPTFFWEPS